MTSFRANLKKTALYILVIAGAFAPCLCAWLSVSGVHRGLLTTGIVGYAATLGLAARRLEKKNSWSGVALCVSVALLGAAMAWITARRH